MDERLGRQKVATNTSTASPESLIPSLQPFDAFFLCALCVYACKAASCPPQAPADIIPRLL
jgi:hypothetical protein